MVRIRKRIEPLGAAGAPQSGRNRPSRPPIVRDSFPNSCPRLCNNALYRHRILRRLSFVLAIVALAIQPTVALRAAQTPDAGAFLTSLNQRVIEQVMEAGITREEQRHRFRALLKESFDVPTISRFVLGRYWRVASEHDQQAFVEVFEEVIVRSFLPLFIEYVGARLDVGRMRWNANGPHYVIVSSRVWRTPGDVLKVDWRIRVDGNQYKIVDVVVEGVSIASTLRSEYSLLIRRQGGDVGVFVDRLREEPAGDEDLASSIATEILQVDPSARRRRDRLCRPAISG